MKVTVLETNDEGKPTGKTRDEIVPDGFWVIEVSERFDRSFPEEELAYMRSDCHYTIVPSKMDLVHQWLVKYRYDEDEDSWSFNCDVYDYVLVATQPFLVLQERNEFEAPYVRMAQQVAGGKPSVKPELHLPPSKTGSDGKEWFRLNDLAILLNLPAETLWHFYFEIANKQRADQLEFKGSGAVLLTVPMLQVVLDDLHSEPVELDHSRFSPTGTKAIDSTRIWVPRDWAENVWYLYSFGYKPADSPRPH